MTRYKVRIRKKIFSSEESGYAVLKAISNEHRDGINIVGNLFDINEGDTIEIEGEPVVHPKFGPQIKVKSFQSVLPEDKEGIIKYLSERIDGVGKRSAKKIADHFGDDTFKILEQNPQRLSEIKGIKKTVIADIQQKLKENKTQRELTVKLAPFGIGSETIFKIYKEFGDKSFQVLSQNPYILIDKIRGIGFKTADMVAKGFEITGSDSNRIAAGIDFTLSNVETRNGDLYIEEKELIVRSAALLDVDEKNIEDQLRFMIDNGQAVRELIPHPVIMSNRNYSLEKLIAKSLYNLSQSTTNNDTIQIDFNAISKRTSVELTDEQREAVKSAACNRITIITGGPGTGKTTIIRAIIEAMEQAKKNVLIAAPTGRAAKRVEEATSCQASTIHRMLKINPENRQFVHNEQNPLQADVIIVDEFSMVDFFIFYSLLKAISQHTRLIIIGDKDQLPSVGPGNVLRDIINCGYFKIIYLNRNFRQNEDSLIIENAYRINSGEELIIKPYSDTLDFVFIPVTNETQAMKKVIGIIEYYKNDYNYNSSDYQVLVPMYRGDSGIDNLNHQVQQQFNTEPMLVKKEKISFKRWDKVMQLKNNYEKEIFNGEQGVICDYNHEKNMLLVDFDGNYIQYGMEELDELTLSYAVSVHKAQGSEYEMLILVLLPTHYIMLNRELFYTAVTRAKKKIFLISDKETVNTAIANSRPSERKTLLPFRLKDVFEKS